MKDSLKGIGTIALWLAVLAGLVFLSVLFIKGGVWVSIKLLPLLSIIMGWVFWICLLVFTPLAFFRKSMRFAGVGLFLASYVFGALLWTGSLVFTYTLWGMLAVFLGLFLLGIGVVPFALLATLFKGMWADFSAWFFYSSRRTVYAFSASIR